MNDENAKTRIGNGNANQIYQPPKTTIERLRESSATLSTEALEMAEVAKFLEANPLLEKAVLAIIKRGRGY
jgi:hypothetical protein